MSADLTRFELARFRASPVSGDVAIVEVRGRFETAPRNGDTPSLLVEHDGAELELPALAPIARDDGQWQASFAVPARSVADGRYALALHDVLLDLPAPDVTPGVTDKLVDLARELNAARRGAQEAEARALAAEEAARVALERAESAATRMDELAEQAGALTTEREELRRELAEARKALKGARAEAEAQRRELAKAEAARPKPPEPEPQLEDLPTRVAAASPPADGAEPTRVIEATPGETVRLLGDRPSRARRVSQRDMVDAELPEPPPPIVGYVLAAILLVVFLVLFLKLLVL